MSVNSKCSGETALMRTPLHVCEQQMLWRDCAYAQARLSPLLVAFVITLFSCAGSYVLIFQRKEKKERVNRILESLCAGIVSPSKKRHDLSYLFVGDKKT